MVFKSVFNSLSEVQQAINTNDINSEDIYVYIDKQSLRVSLKNKDEFFEGYKEDAYYMSPGEPHAHQVLFYQEFSDPTELCVELLHNFFDSELDQIEYRGDRDSTNFI